MDNQEELPYVVPGAYLIRPGPLTLVQVREELESAGLLFIRRFIVGAPRSDYLALFDPKILAQHAREEKAALSTPSITTGVWVKRVQAEAAPLTVTVPIVTVAARVANLEPELTATSKKVRPGRRAREMLKALKTDAEPLMTTVAAVAPPPALQATPSAPEPSPQPQPKTVDLTADAGILVDGTKGTVFQLRPFRVKNNFVPDRGFVPHLSINLAPLPGRPTDVAALAHVDKCHQWIKAVLQKMIVCGMLPDARACRVLCAQTDASRLARENLRSLQCRFQPETPMLVRNAVYAVLRTAVWFSSQIDDTEDSADSYIVRCWWRPLSQSAA